MFQQRKRSLGSGNKRDGQLQQSYQINVNKMGAAQRKMSQDQNSKLQQEKISLQESLIIFGDQNLKLERRNQDLQDSRMCKICMDQEVSQVFNPCSHAICCNICINSLQKCPICRKNIESSQMLYF